MAYGLIVTAWSGIAGIAGFAVASSLRIRALARFGVHGANLAVVTAMIVGVINAELFRRSRSIWPGVVVHAVNNLVGTGIGILIAAGT